MQITVFRGNQIGGCVTEIRTAQARIIIDLGAELPKAKGEECVPLKIEGVTEGEPDCDGVFITHYHGDHAGMFERVLPSVPVYMGGVAKEIYKIVQKTAKRKLDKGNPELVEGFIPFNAGEPISVKDITITPYAIDHSAFDAYMFLIEAEGKRVLHTGDFRMHGVRGRKMPAVFEKYAQNIDVLLCEGTMLSRRGEKVMTEHELGNRARQILRENKNVFVLCSSTNIDTIAEFLSAATDNKKPFIVCESEQLEILNAVSKGAISPFYKFEDRKIYVYGKNLHEYMQKCGFCFVGRANYATERALEAFPKNALVYSMWEGYLDKSRPAFNANLSRVVEAAKASGSSFLPLHTSGHATKGQIELVCNITGAKTVVPIHTEAPQAFKELNIKGEVKILKSGEAMPVL